MPPIYLNDLDDFMEDDSDLDTDISETSHEDFKQFLIDSWGTSDMDELNWYGICFPRQYFQGESQKCRDAWNNIPNNDREKNEYIKMAMFSEACLNNRLDIAKYIYVTEKYYYNYTSKDHSWYNLFEKVCTNTDIDIEIVKWILKVNKEHNLPDGIRKKDLFYGIRWAWAHDNKNVIELIYNINPSYIFSDEELPGYHCPACLGNTLDKLFNNACKQHLINIAKWLTSLNNKFHITIEKDVIKKYNIDT